MRDIWLWEGAAIDVGQGSRRCLLAIEDPRWRSRLVAACFRLHDWLDLAGGGVVRGARHWLGPHNATLGTLSMLIPSPMVIVAVDKCMASIRYVVL